MRWLETENNYQFNLTNYSEVSHSQFKYQVIRTAHKSSHKLIAPVEWCFLGSALLNNCSTFAILLILLGNNPNSFPKSTPTSSYSSEKAMATLSL